MPRKTAFYSFIHFSLVPFSDILGTELSFSDQTFSYRSNLVFKASVTFIHHRLLFVMD